MEPTVVIALIVIAAGFLYLAYVIKCNKEKDAAEASNSTSDRMWDPSRSAVAYFLSRVSAQDSIYEFYSYEEICVLLNKSDSALTSKLSSFRSIALRNPATRITELEKHIDYQLCNKSNYSLRWNTVKVLDKLKANK